MFLLFSTKLLALRHTTLSVSLSQTSSLFELRRFASSQRVVRKSGKPNASLTHRRTSVPEKVVPQQSSKAAAAGPTMRMSRFYRVAQERGFAFALYFYIIGETLTLSVLYALHTGMFGGGDAFSLLKALSFDRIIDLDRLAQVGPTVWGLQLSPRLFLNYLMANAITYPFYRVQMGFCAATFMVIRAALSPFVRLVRARRRSALPKAPSSAGNKTKARKSHQSLTR